MVQIPAKKQMKAKDPIRDVLYKAFFTLHEVQLFTEFLSFCAYVVRFSYVFMYKLWDFVTPYLYSSSRFSKYYIPSNICLDLEWWIKLLLA